MSMAGAAGFALVLGGGLWRGTAPSTVLMGALFAAVGFGLFARLWMELMLHGLADSLLARQARAETEAVKRGETDAPDGAPLTAPNER